MVRITGTRYCVNLFGQPNILTFLHLSTRQCPGSPCSHDWLHCCWLRCRTSSDSSTGHQTAWISIRLTTRYRAFCKSEGNVAASVTSTIRMWKNDWFTNGAALINVSLTERSASGDSCICEKGGQFEVGLVIEYCSHTVVPFTWYCLHFLARDSIMLSALFAIARPSARLSVTRVDQRWFSVHFFARGLDALL